MKKLILLLAILLSGCTTYSNIETIDDNEYYLVKNTRLLFVISIPAIDKCSAGEDEILECVNVR